MESGDVEGGREVGIAEESHQTALDLEAGARDTEVELVGTAIDREGVGEREPRHLTVARQRPRDAQAATQFEIGFRRAQPHVVTDAHPDIVELQVLHDGPRCRRQQTVHAETRGVDDVDVVREIERPALGECADVHTSAIDPHRTFHARRIARARQGDRRGGGHDDRRRARFVDRLKFVGGQSQIERRVGDFPDADRSADADRILRRTTGGAYPTDQDAVAEQPDVSSRLVQANAKIVE